MYKLLIADDEPLEREAVRYIINENFPGLFEINEAANGLEVVELASSFKPDLIFLDIKMPGINGLQAASRINRILPETRIIIVTAYHYFNYAKEALSLGAVDYITKPTPSETVVATVNRVIANLESEHFKERLTAEKEQRLQQITRYFEDDLLVLISYGEIDETIITEYFGFLNLNYHTFLAVAAVIAYPNVPAEVVSEIEKRVLKKNVVDWLKSYFLRSGYHAFIRSSGPEILILLLLKENLNEYQSRVMGMQLFTTLKEDLWGDLQIQLSIGVGSSCMAPHQIYQAFLQAKYALRYENAPGSLTSFGDIQKERGQAVYPVNLEKRLVQSVLQGDLQNSLQILDHLTGWLLENTAASDIFSQKVYELLLILTREITMNTHLNEFNTDLEEIRLRISGLAGVDEVSVFARDFLSQKIAEINGYKTSRVNALLNLAIGYMEQNYQKDLSLEDVSSFVQISPFYLSKMFKKEIGENFIDYLTTIRIEKAKQFLANPMFTIKDVCYQVGYKDPNYFTRVFKKTTGITPTEYQAQKMK